MAKHKALFLDRDGVINVESGYIYRPEEVVFIGGIFDFCRKARVQGYLLIVVTNQSGIGRGYYSEGDLQALMRWMGERFIQENCPLAAYYYCPHHPEYGIGKYQLDCDCRKPKPGMILQAAKEWDIDLTQSMLIGDHPRDIEAAKRAGIEKRILFNAATDLLTYLH